MIKYFHKLTRDEFKELCKDKPTWAEVSRDYPQPEWCSYPDAVQGMLGCWSLIDFKVYGRNYCKHCEYYIKKSQKVLR